VAFFTWSYAGPKIVGSSVKIWQYLQQIWQQQYYWFLNILALWGQARSYWDNPRTTGDSNQSLSLLYLLFKLKQPHTHGICSFSNNSCCWSFIATLCSSLSLHPPTRTFRCFAGDSRLWALMLWSPGSSCCLQIHIKQSDSIEFIPSVRTSRSCLLACFWWSDSVLLSICWTASTLWSVKLISNFQF